MSFAEYGRYDALGLADLVARSEVSATELLETAIERIERVNPQLGAVVDTFYDRARRQIDAGLPDGPFKGVPFLLKDLGANLAGVKVTSGSRFLRDYVADHDATLTQRYLASGVTILGRTASPELGLTGHTEPELHGPARNPWDPDHTPGGSSGGSAAAVAARMVPMAHGGDGGGSIRIPASACGLFGLKPTRARNPMGPLVGEGWAGLVCEHVLTRSVRDSAAMLDCTAGPDLGAPYWAPPTEGTFLEQCTREPGRLRIAFSDVPLFGRDTHPDCKAALADAVSLLEDLGHEVEAAAPTFDRRALIRAYVVIVAAGVAARVALAAEAVGRSPSAGELESGTWFMMRVAELIPSAEYTAVLNLVHRTSREIAKFFEPYDVFVTPSLAYPPVRVGELAPSALEKFLIGLLGVIPTRAGADVGIRRIAGGRIAKTPNTMLFNMTGQPAASVPLWWNAAGLPIGTQLVGRFGDEATLLKLAAQLEAARPWSDRLPAVS